jgi:hypothetical protein
MKNEVVDGGERRNKTKGVSDKNIPLYIADQGNCYKSYGESGA